MTREPWQITRDMFLSFQETDDLLRHIRDQDAVAAESETKASTALGDRLIVETLLFSGLRNSELCRLTLRDAPPTLREPALQVRGTPREDRTVFIPGSLAELIRRYVREVHGLNRPPAPASPDLDRPLLVNERGRPYERTGLYRRVVRILTEAGLSERASVQLLRHTYGYLAYARTGGNLLFVQRQLGHAHPQVTSIYAQFVEESYSQLADSVAGSSKSHSPPVGKASRPRTGPARRKA